MRSDGFTADIGICGQQRQQQQQHGSLSVGTKGATCGARASFRRLASCLHACVYSRVRAWAACQDAAGERAVAPSGPGVGRLGVARPPMKCSRAAGAAGRQPIPVGATWPESRTPGVCVRVCWGGGGLLVMRVDCGVASSDVCNSQSGTWPSSGSYEVW
ncbi:hypothetical protein PLESTB_001132200 [Pleodorina starrii]|uniref:Uncharacterized protein n=1 Tax=Pleodorina starrii TaxID=330485 RepID=A0A9W6BS09_9CHLO|nr:hypothetical protein PLESTM_001369600 [Pleodorina starrii]GLC56662.1 hypothetical protein PLESTB_001132200 [Pleodorina starrii]GLC69049.1 hypothetical protein PLESTF_000774100 [Pleodorina starrii]